MLGFGPAWRRLMEDLKWAGLMSEPVLLLGEIGTGKTRLARELHERGRGGRPFVEARLRGAMGDVAIADLLGKAKGAHTDSREAVEGWLERAGDGTILVNDVNCLAPELQHALVPVLDGEPVSRVGAPGRGVPVRARFVFTSNEHPDEVVERGRMFADFASRILVHVVRVPSLRERREDIPRLAAQLADHFARRAGVLTPRISREADEELAAHRWDRNFRELQAVVMRLIQRHSTEVEITSSMVRQALGSPEAAAEAPISTDSADRFVPGNVRRALARAHGNVAATAELLGCSESHLRRVLKRMGHPRRNRRRGQPRGAEESS